MAWRIQNLKTALGENKQTNISTAGSTFICFTKLNARVETAKYGTETNKTEIGKGNEFITQVFPTAWDAAGSIEKFGSAEFMTWGWAYALGGVSYSAGTYTIIPIDPAVTLELPYFSYVQQGSEGGSSAIDELFLGCAIEEIVTEFKYGPGRESVKTTVNWVGSGALTIPSGVSIPATQSESYMVSQSMAATINGNNYVSGKTLLGGTIGWKNNLLLNQGFFPGSGVTTNGYAGAGAAAIRGRIEIGDRVPTFTFQARMLHNSPEFQDLVAQTSGSATLTFTYDGTHTVTFTFEKVTYESVVRGVDSGLVTVEVVVAPQFTTNLISVSAQCGIAAIAQ